MAIRKIIALLLAVLLLIWGTVVFECRQSEKNLLREADIRSITQAQLFSEYSKQTISRIDELLLDVRMLWGEDRRNFERQLNRRRVAIENQKFQIMVLDRAGKLSFSTQAISKAQADQSQHTGFIVHQQAGTADELYISPPAANQDSDKWLIYFSRPILREGKFDGVVMISISPDVFSLFAKKMNLGKGASIGMVRYSGEMMARYPATNALQAQASKTRAYFKLDAPISGNYRALGTLSGQDKIHGYYKLQEYGLICVVAYEAREVLVPYFAYRNTAVWVAVFVSTLSILLFYMWMRSLRVLDKTREKLIGFQARAATSNEARHACVADISEKLSVPMSKVSALLQQLKPLENDQSQRQVLKALLKSNEEMHQVVDQLRDLARLESGTLDLRQEPFSLTELVSSLAPGLEESARARGVELTIKISPVINTPYIGDDLRIRRILNNFVHYIIGVSGQGMVTLKVTRLMEGLRFEINRANSGNTKEDLERRLLGERRDDSANICEDQDLSLYLSKYYIEAMGGRMGWDRETQNDHRIWFILPLQPA